jgi:hypothetical protein
MPKLISLDDIVKNSSGSFNNSLRVFFRFFAIGTPDYFFTGILSLSINTIPNKDLLLYLKDDIQTVGEVRF